MEPSTRQIDPVQTWGLEDVDERGRYLYPGDVEDAMPEGNLAFLSAIYLLQTLRRWIDPLRDSVHANLPIYYVRGNPKKHVSPDVFFGAGIPYLEDRVSYRIWESGVPPRVVFEIVSRGSEIKDVVVNRGIYEQLRIPEYYWFEPRTNRLVALELDTVTGRYRERAPNPSGRHLSTALGVELGVEGHWIGIYRDGAYVPPTENLLEAAERDKQQAEREKGELERRWAEDKRGQEARVAEALVRGKREMLLHLLRARFDDVPEDVATALAAIEDGGRLDALVEQALRVSRPQDIDFAR